MLNYNFLNNYRNWGDGLDKISHEMPYKHEDFRKSLNPNTMEAAIWMVDNLKKIVDLTKTLDITILNSWLGFPLVPLLCENLNVTKMNLIDIDKIKVGDIVNLENGDKAIIEDIEILEFENFNQYSLAQVYNKGISQSKYNIVCCIHNDVKLEKNWGKRLLEDFQNNPDYGIIGKAGSCYFPESGVYWEKMSQTMVGQVYHHPPGQKIGRAHV